MNSLQHTVDIDILLSDRQRLAAMKKEIDAQLEEANGSIRQELIDRGLDTYQTDDYTVSLSVRERKTLDKGLLVELGVGTDVIEKATKASSYVQLDVRAKK